MKLGIIGAGTIVKEFLPKLVKFEGIEVLGILAHSNIEEKRKLAQENGVALACTELDELCASGIDTVYIALPNHLHYEYCKDCLNRNLNVIVEKPITSSYHEVLELSELARSKQLFLFEAITTPYFNGYKRIKEWLPLIGDIKVVQCQFSQYSRRYDAFKNGEILPVFDVNKAGGVLMDLCIYNIFYTVGLFGEPKDIHYYPNMERGIDTSGVLVMNYDNFVAVSITAKDSKGIQGSIIQGDKGIIKSELPTNMIGKVTLELNDGTYEEYDDGFANERLVPEFTSFIEMINNKDYETSYKMLDMSLLVSKLLTKARLDQGIVFPSDK